MKPPAAIRCETTLGQALDALVAHEPGFAVLRAEAGPVPLRATAPGFAGLARIVIGQQVSTHVASVLSARLEAALPELAPEAYLNAGEDVWRACGLSRPKQKTLKAVAEAMTSGRLDLDRIADMPVAEAMSAMTAIHGIGPWTAEVHLLFGVGHVDIFPSKDLALQEAVRRMDGLERRPTDKDLAARAESWAPHRSAAARLLWAHYNADPGVGADSG